VHRGGRRGERRNLPRGLAAVTALDRVNLRARRGGRVRRDDPGAIKGRGARRRPRARRPRASRRRGERRASNLPRVLAAVTALDCASSRALHGGCVAADPDEQHAPIKCSSASCIEASQHATGSLARFGADRLDGRAMPTSSARLATGDLPDEAPRLTPASCSPARASRRRPGRCTAGERQNLRPCPPQPTPSPLARAS